MFGGFAPRAKLTLVIAIIILIAYIHLAKVEI
jgi:hypothetical protein